MNETYIIQSPLFYESPFHAAYVEALEKKNQLKARLLQGESVSLQYAEANMALLETESRLKPALETRAMFFNYIQPEQWQTFDHETVGRQVRKLFCGDYPRKAYAEDMLDKLVSRAWSRGEMDMATSNQLFHKVCKRTANLNASRYKVEAEKVNRSVERKVLQEMHTWVQRYDQSARTAAEAFGEAYRFRPRSLRDSNYVATFADMMAACRS